MKKYIWTLLIIIGAGVSFGQQSNESIEIGGQTRTYIQYLPDNFQPSESLPVIFALHGLGGSAQDMANAGFQAIADTARFIVLLPQGADNFQGQPSWNNATGLASTANDIGLFQQLMDSMVLLYNADPTRIYFTGFSMGSIMSHHMACELNDRVAAIGAMAGTMATSDIQNCQPEYATPVIHLHGTDDSVVPYDEDPLPTLSLVPETMNFWRNVHGCDDTADSTRIPDTATDNIDIDRFVYDNCDEAGAVELWRLNGADHIYLYEPVNDITEAEEVWLFFRRWSHPGPTTVGLNDQRKESLKIFPNPSNGSFTVTSSTETEAFIRSVDGKMVSPIHLSNGTNTLDINLPRGLYYFITSHSIRRLIVQ